MMQVFGVISSVLGLVCVGIAGIVVLPKIFITDEELKLLSDLPLEPSTSNMTGKITRANLPVAVTDVTKLNEYREKYIQARSEERSKGRIGLGFLVFGSFLQVVGLILAIL